MIGKGKTCDDCGSISTKCKCPVGGYIKKSDAVKLALEMMTPIEAPPMTEDQEFNVRMYDLNQQYVDSELKKKNL